MNCFTSIQVCLGSEKSRSKQGKLFDNINKVWYLFHFPGCLALLIYTWIMVALGLSE